VVININISKIIFFFLLLLILLLLIFEVERRMLSSAWAERYIFRTLR